MRIYYPAGLLSIFLLIAWQLSAAETHIKSGPQQTMLLELYTSEGCNSCPPAERYLNQFIDDRRLWNSIIPMAFHVDYWDYLGWKDRFSHPSYSARQRIYARHLSSRTVYTPAFFINGRNWRRGLLSKNLPAIPPAPAGILTLKIRQNDLQAEYQPATAGKQSLTLNLAILGTGLHSRITRGENRGLESHHQFVVLSYRELSGEQNHWRTRLIAPEIKAPRYAIAVWVNRADDPTPVQAAGGWLSDQIFD